MFWNGRRQISKPEKCHHQKLGSAKGGRHNPLPQMSASVCSHTKPVYSRFSMAHKRLGYFYMPILVLWFSNSWIERSLQIRLINSSTHHNHTWQWFVTSYRFVHDETKDMQPPNSVEYTPVHRYVLYSYFLDHSVKASSVQCGPTVVTIR